MELRTLHEIKFVDGGEIESYMPEKMFSFLTKLGIDEDAAQELMNDFIEETNEFVKVEDVIFKLEKLAARKITLKTQIYEKYASLLHLAGVLKKNFDGKYPSLDILKNSIRIRQEHLNQYSEAELEELNSYIKPERDSLFTYKAATIFISKYCLSLDQYDKLREMPQIAYMRIALFLNKDEKVNRIQAVKDLYDSLSLHQFTVATPIAVNALTLRPQTSSCVLITAGDSTESILDTNFKAGLMSARTAGIGLDIGEIRSNGSKIVNGTTSGPIPFLKIFEKTMQGFNQGGTRPGSLAAYFNWWHEDVLDLLELRRNGGTDENRVRQLKYALKVNEFFLNAVMNDDIVALISPHHCPELNYLYGKEFEEKYLELSKDPKYKKIKAREIWRNALRARIETGNLYFFHYENVNNVSMLADVVASSNLCTEITLPQRPNQNYEFTWKVE